MDRILHVYNDIGYDDGGGMVHHGHANVCGWNRDQNSSQSEMQRWRSHIPPPVTDYSTCDLKEHKKRLQFKNQTNKKIIAAPPHAREASTRDLCLFDVGSSDLELVKYGDLLHKNTVHHKINKTLACIFNFFCGVTCISISVWMNEKLTSNTYAPTAFLQTSSQHSTSQYFWKCENGCKKRSNEEAVSMSRQMIKTILSLYGQRIWEFWVLHVAKMTSSINRIVCGWFLDSRIVFDLNFVLNCDLNPIIVLDTTMDHARSSASCVQLHVGTIPIFMSFKDSLYCPLYKSGTKTEDQRPKPPKPIKPEIETVLT